MSRLGDRLGLNSHVSPLGYKVAKLMERYPLPGCDSIEEWLMAVAFFRGFRIVRLPRQFNERAVIPALDDLSNEELAVALCQSERRDEPQMLRLPAQMISRKVINVREIILVARRERVTRILAELARQAVMVEPDHELWKAIHKQLGKEPAFSQPVVHWSRIAEPVMKNGRFNAEKWVLVS